MGTAAEPGDILEFEAPHDADPKHWAPAEKAALRFPEQFVKKARELNECRRDMERAFKLCEDKEQVVGFVIRNLITVVNNCKAALASAPAEAIETAALAGVQRTVMHLLEELQVTRVDLLGRTYEDVEVDGETIHDPFEILESEQKGKSGEVT